MISVKDYNEPCKVEAIYDNLDVKIKGCLCYNLVFECRYYLRPMSSMTEEEFVYFMGLRGRMLQSYKIQSMMKEAFNASQCMLIVTKLGNYSDKIDWLNAHHFDYHGLIEKGLALEAPEGMY